ncbi:glycosyltransferase family 2 protein [Ideonella sp. B7]|uniref:glycosyltransferase family 2 protein n=1 Tax=Ideonella benzenivorans TaxID=2831643 RepID=UPI001CEDB2D2|nr:glycosyltransferase family 2 protein [Ideonella benzenivorans]MCA6216843.1 glycosyltransferase family 2 protein [Ideonella benzenivorans]
MTSPLLTIAIPTYNRADCLERLLKTLLVELRGLETRVSVVVSDNASTDRTQEVVAAFAARFPSVRALRNTENLGMDGNFLACAEHVDGTHFWLLSDDDLPRTGLVCALLGLLERESPDLVYMDSRWLPEIADSDPTHPVTMLQGVRLGQLAFARRVHVWTTYLSGMVVRASPLLREPTRLRRYAGTQVSQLAWVLEALSDGSRFIHVTTPCILATEGNTGGYKVLKVFGQHVPAIMREMLPTRVAHAMLRRMAATYLPNLLCGLREARLGRFEREDATEVLRPQFGSTLAFRWLLEPIGHGSSPASVRRALWLARQVHRALRAHDRLAERLDGGTTSL